MFRGLSQCMVRKWRPIWVRQLQTFGTIRRVAVLTRSVRLSRAGFRAKLTEDIRVHIYCFATIIVTVFIILRLTTITSDYVLYCTNAGQTFHSSTQVRPLPTYGASEEQMIEQAVCACAAKDMGTGENDGDRVQVQTHGTD